MSLILNILWLILGGGLLTGGAWFLAGLLFALSIVGLPWARAAFNIGFYTLLPFGQTAVSRDELSGREDIGTGPLGLLGNLIWFVCFGWWLAFGHLVLAAGYAVTIIGLPFAWVHLKLVPIALFPIGQAVVPNGVAYGSRYGRR
ncbi:MAG TPA: YccF domain-containing protein [Aliidongia sp.]|uniref:YccF domain-containing protein n=1 Tax=Aliidongia sp. TaxID=1914230 RepID=UPI002DDCB1C7|nr:YccF domain-containing protein [Aliidongia sp.]HEV2675680.1 YccF domain-containing protein [Aliidongia sp.]